MASAVIAPGRQALVHRFREVRFQYGEYFIRLTVAREVCALVQYKGLKLQEAADHVIHKELKTLGGDGGLIAITPDGQMAWSFNTPGMYRARQVEGGKLEIGIFAEPPFKTE